MSELINWDRLKEIETIQLRHGTGKGLSEQICVMQAVDYITSGGLSDHPECSCPALTDYAIRLNDRMDDEMRQKLKPLIPKLVGTRNSKTKERAEFLVHYVITATLPIFTDAFNMPEDSAKLRAFQIGQWEKMQAFCDGLRPRISDAAAAAAAAAAAYAAYAADYAKRSFWQAVRIKIWESAMEGLAKACEIREAKQ